jgi:signal transduction histidine kinase
MSKEFLRRLRLFQDVSEEDLDRIYDMAVTRTLEPGDLLVREGEMGTAMYIVLDGEFEVTKQGERDDVVLGRRGAGEVIGEMSLLAKEPRVASARAVQSSQVLEISHFAFDQLLACSRSAGPTILHGMASRLRSTEALLAQQEKMAGLGKLTAGLAHELNNPAAAAWRSAEQLREVFAKWQRLSADLETLEFNEPQRDKLKALRNEMEARASGPVTLDPLTRSDREGDLQIWLEDRGIDESWELAPTLVGLGWAESDLDDTAGIFGEGQIEVVIPWLAAGFSAYTLLDEVRMSAEKISELVKAVKSYSYLDQAPVQQVDVHEGLDNTLVILRHKLKHGVTVTREYDPNVPRIEAYGSELNQVWTNIIDNAVDAMGGEGGINIRTHSEGDDVVVEITDNGPGIPRDVLPRIFQPFYTTKEQGKGTGLGLHIAYNIVVDKHRGDIAVESKPGETRFRVCLPVELARE